MEKYQIMDVNGHIENRSELEKLGFSATDCLKIYEKMALTRFFTDWANREADDGHMVLNISPKGQEAAQIASAYAIENDDWIFWYLRSYGAALARGVSIDTIWGLLYGIPDEKIFQELLSHNVMFPYILVGSYLTHATGLAGGNKILNQPGISVAYFGEGATAEGDFHEALNWAAIYKIPTIFFCENNHYAISTPNNLQKSTETFAEKAKAYNMAFGYVDGNDPFAVYAITKQAVNRAKKYSLPTLIEAVTYRLDPHTTAVRELVVQPQKEIQDAQKKEPLIRMKKFLLTEAKNIFGIEWSETQDKNLLDELSRLVESSAKKNYELLKSINGKDVIKKIKEEASKIRVNKKYLDIQFSLGDEPEEISNATCRDAINFAHKDVMSFDPTIMILGEDVGKAGSVYQTIAISEEYVKKHLPQFSPKLLFKHLPMQAIYGDKRIVDTPLDEEGIVGHAIGLALAGLRPECEIQFSGFVFKAFSQIVSHLARLMHRAGYQITLPIVIRLPYGAGRYIEHHRECEIPFFLPTPGLLIVAPLTVQDTYDLLWASFASDKPVLFFEHKELYRKGEKSNLIRKPPCLPDTNQIKPLEAFGARIAKKGNDVTIVTYGHQIYTCLNAAEDLLKDGIDAEIIDLRIISPLDKETVINSVMKTGKLVTVEENPAIGGVGAELGASVFESCRAFLGSLDSQLIRIAPPPILWPAYSFHKYYVPQPVDIVEKVKELFLHKTKKPAG